MSTWSPSCPAGDYGAQVLGLDFVNAALPAWASPPPGYGAGPQAITCGLNLGYYNGGYWMPGQSDYQAVYQWSDECSVNANDPGYATLEGETLAAYNARPYVGVLGSSSGYKLTLTNLTPTQIAMLPSEYSSAKFLGTSLNTFPGCAGQGVYEWQVYFSKGTGLWQSCILFDQDSTNPLHKTEIDFEFDGGNPDVINLTIHWIDASGDTHQSTTIAANVGYDMTTRWSTLTVRWASDYVTWYCNGTQIGQVTTPTEFTGRSVCMMCNFAACAGNPGWFSGPPSFSGAEYFAVAKMGYWSPPT